mgnify:CR=1 FL=1
MAKFKVESFKDAILFLVFSLIVFSLLKLYMNTSSSVITYLLEQSKQTHELQDEL